MGSRLLHETETRTQYNIHNTIQTQTRTQHKKYGSNLEECLQIYNDNNASGAVFVCTFCLQTWFKGSVFTVEHIKLKQVEEERLFQVCCVGYKSHNDIEWICQTCSTAIHECKMFSIYNKLKFPPQPPELKLYPLEEWLVALHIPFMQIKNLQHGGPNTGVWKYCQCSSEHCTNCKHTTQTHEGY